MISCGIVAVSSVILFSPVVDESATVAAIKETFLTMPIRQTPGASPPLVMDEDITAEVQTAFEVSTPRAMQKGRLFVCGYDRGRLQNYLFDDFIHVQGANASYPSFDQHKQLSMDYNYTEHDVVVIGMGGDCDSLGIGNGYPNWIHKTFPGKALICNGEARESLTGKGTWMISSQPTSKVDQNLYVTFMAMAFVGFVPESLWPTITWADSPRHHLDNSNKTFLVYFASNCLNFRARTALLLAQIGIVHHAECPPLYEPDLFQDTPFMEVAKLYNVTPKTENIQRAPNLDGDWGGNYKQFSEYKFCLVMENEAVDGYITEKIMMAFVAGCIPIYYGCQQVFDVFNRDAFLFWNVRDKDAPQVMFNRVKYLHTNYTAYDEMLKQPVLANGNESLRVYFSLSDHVGNGELKHKIRTMMGIDSD